MLKELFSDNLKISKFTRIFHMTSPNGQHCKIYNIRQTWTKTLSLPIVKSNITVLSIW